MEEIKFLIDETAEERKKLLEEIHVILSEKPSKVNERTIFLKDFTISLIKACSKVKPSINYKEVEPYVGESSSGIIKKEKIDYKPLTFKLPKVKIVKKKITPEYSHRFDKQSRPSLKVPTPTRAIVDDNLKVKDEVYYYEIKNIGKKDEFKELSPLVNDIDVKSIYVEGVGKQVLIDYQDKEKVFTKLFFNDLKQINNIIISVARNAGQRISFKEPFFDVSYRSMRIQGSLGTKFASPKLVIKKL